MFVFFFSSRRRHTRWPRDWSSDVCSSDLGGDAERDVDQLPEVEVVLRAGLVVAKALHEVVGAPLADRGGRRQPGLVDLDDGRVRLAELVVAGEGLQVDLLGDVQALRPGLRHANDLL